MKQRREQRYRDNARRAAARQEEAHANLTELVTMLEGAGYECTSRYGDLTTRRGRLEVTPATTSATRQVMLWVVAPLLFWAPILYAAWRYVCR